MLSHYLKNLIGQFWNDVICEQPLSEDTLHHQPQRRDNGHHQPQRQPRGGDNGHHQQQKHQGGGGNGHADLWECSTCTFHNKQSRNICEMCSKSRDFAPQADIRSVEPAQVTRKLSVPKIDGVACSKCTLVNSAKNKLCDACGATLPKNFWESFHAIQEEVDFEKEIVKKEKIVPDDFPPLSSSDKKCRTWKWIECKDS